MGNAQRISDIYRSIESIDYRSIDNKLKESMVYRSIDRDYRSIIETDNSSGSQIRQRRIAERILEHLKEPKSWKFYLKCAYRLTEDKIWELVELATRPNVKYPNRYFVFLAKKEMEKANLSVPRT